MLFKLTSTSRMCSNLTKIKEDWPEVIKYGPVFTSETKISRLGNPYIDEHAHIDIATLDQLMDFIKDCGGCVVLTDEDDRKEIEIYDDWRE